MTSEGQTKQSDGRADVLRSLPSVDELISSDAAAELEKVVGRRRLTDLARETIQEMRAEIAGSSETAVSRETLHAELSERLTALVHKELNRETRRVVNATGVIVHTNLGRAPLSNKAQAALEEAARYCTLEYDVETGKRGARAPRAEELISQLTGAEAAVVVNNCASAAFLVLSTFAAGKETVVSRGELVEIGGDFRIPDVLAQSGSRMREVGTTNRTKISDYENAIGEETAMLLRVHPSNYRIVGFTETPPLADLVALARERDVLLFEDAGSGALVDLSPFGLTEPLIADSVSAGVDLVCFSGDKLLGGPQAGIVAGRGELIEKIRRHPLYRALRLDKLRYAALEATLGSYSRGAEFQEVPVLTAIAAGKDSIEERARALAEGLSALDPALSAHVRPGHSVIGGGSAPDVRLDTELVAVTHPAISAADLDRELRRHRPPIVARIEDDNVVLDLRTVEPDDEAAIKDAISTAVGRLVRGVR
jgi:L-seryl-tRNA(Ser) seleniumtransferase